MRSLHLHERFNAATDTVTSAAAFPVAAKSRFVEHRERASLARHPFPPLRPTHVIDAAAIEIPRPKRLRPHAHLSHALREALARDEKILGVGRFHPVYLFYTAFFGGLLWLLAAPLGLSMQASADEIAAYLSQYQVGGDIDFDQLANILTVLGHYALAQVCLMLGSGSFLGITGDMAFQSVQDFFASHLWGSVPVVVLRGMGFLFVTFRLLRMLTTEIIVTGERLLFKRGILVVRTLKIPLRQLTRVDVNQTWLGNLLGYGSIHVYTNSWDTEGSGAAAHPTVRGVFLPAVAHPQYLSTLIEHARGEARSNPRNKAD